MAIIIEVPLQFKTVKYRDEKELLEEPHPKAAP
jgi:hypothetical protein